MKNLLTNNLTIRTKKENLVLVNRLSFQIKESESLILLGQSGCGKTITCRTVMGILDKTRFRTEGSITFDGLELLNLSENKRGDIYGKKIAFIPQNPMTALDPSMRVGRQMDEMLRLHTDLKAVQRRERIEHVLTDAGLDSTDRIYKSFPFMLSGGMLQRILIAMAMSTKAELVVADEPTTALDVVHRNEIVDSFLRLRQAGSAILFVTHDFAAALRLGGDVMVMREGEIIEKGETMTLYQNPQHPYTKALVSASALSRGANNAGC